MAPASSRAVASSRQVLGSAARMAIGDLPLAEDGHRLWTADGNRHATQRRPEWPRGQIASRRLPGASAHRRPSERRRHQFVPPAVFRRKQRPRDSSREGFLASTEQLWPRRRYVQSAIAFRRSGDSRSYKRGGKSRARTNYRGGLNEKYRHGLVHFIAGSGINTNTPTRQTAVIPRMNRYEV